MELPNKIEMELKNINPVARYYGVMVPMGLPQFNILPYSQGDKSYSWQSEFFDINPDLSMKIGLDITQSTKSQIGSQLFNKISTKASFRSKGNNIVPAVLLAPARDPDLEYALRISHTLGLRDRKMDIGVEEYKNNRYLGYTKADNSDRFCNLINPALIPLTADALKRAEYRASSYSIDNKITDDEKIAFDAHKKIALTRLGASDNLFYHCLDKIINYGATQTNCKA